jgi:hypothetical protein
VFAVDRNDCVLLCAIVLRCNTHSIIVTTSAGNKDQPTTEGKKMNIKVTQAQAIVAALAVRGSEGCIVVDDSYRSIVVLDANQFAGCLMAYRSALLSRACVTPKDGRNQASRLKSIAIIESKLE